jgi:FAD binding domain
MPGKRILVVGAGLAGLATARTLARGGFSAEVIERQPVWDEVGTGIYLPANAFRALRALGLEQAVSERGAVIALQRVSDDRGRPLARSISRNGLGPRPDASPRPNSLPPNGRPKHGLARLRPKDLPIELPTSARRGLVSRFVSSVADCHRTSESDTSSGRIAAREEDMGCRPRRMSDSARRW